MKVLSSITDLFIRPLSRSWERWEKWSRLTVMETLGYSPIRIFNARWIHTCQLSSGLPTVF